MPSTIALPIIRFWADDTRPRCADHDPDLWFADRDDRGAQAAARAICATCPLLRPCMSYAINNGENHGMWGGLDPQDRTRVAATAGRRRPSAPRTQPAHVLDNLARSNDAIRAARVAAAREALEVETDADVRRVLQLRVDLPKATTEILAQRLGIRGDAYQARLSRALRRHAKLTAAS